jgi:glutamine synthetase
MASPEVDHHRLGELLDPDQLDALGRWPAKKLTRDELVDLVERGEIESVILATPDTHGGLYGKSMPASLFLAEESMVLSSGPLTYDHDWELFEGPAIGSANGWADMDMCVDWRSLRRLATFEKTAIALTEGVWRNGEVTEELPRRVLSRQLERAAERGYGIVCAIEAEFYIFSETFASAREKDYVNLNRVGETNGDFSILHMGLVDPLLADIRRACMDSGVPIETVKHEWGSVQLELTLTYCDALEAADRIALFKLITKQVCLRHGVVATFMARYSHKEASSSGHMHVSVWDLKQRKNLMVDEDQDPNSLSKLGRNWLGGMMALAPELMPLFCPNVNSYKRLDPFALAPTANGWSIDVRTTPFRQVGKGPSLHIENRIPGADANFYLALAGMVASGLYGIDHDLEPIGEPITTAGSPGEPLPRSLADALGKFRNSEPARELFGDAVVGHLIAAAETDLEIYIKQVSDIERRRLFECA